MTNKSEIQQQKANCRAQLDFYIRQSKQTLRKFGNHVPMFFLEKKPDGIAMLLPDFTDDESKDFSVNKIKELLRQFDSDFFVHVSEAWVIMRKPDEEIIRPSTAKDRQEVLCFVYNQRDGRRINVTIPFEKAKCGRIFFRKSSEQYSGFGRGNDDVTEVGGRFAEISRW